MTKSSKKMKDCKEFNHMTYYDLISANILTLLFHIYVLFIYSFDKVNLLRVLTIPIYLCL